ITQSWWTSYGDPVLNQIVEKALSKNLDLESAAQRIAEARALTGEAKSKLGPTINATSSAQRLRGGFAQGITRINQTTGGSFVSPFETGLLQGGLDMKWELDLFGSNRAAQAASKADLLAEQQKREDLAITVSAEAARYYMELRGIEERLAITNRNIDAQKQLLSLTEDRVKAGLSSQVDIERQSLLLANTEATIPSLEADRTLHLNRLAVLVGDEDFVKSTLPASKTLQAPALKAEIPSDLLKRRPDVRAAEARLAAAMSRLKQARTDLYPKISLNGLMGRQGTSLSTLSLGGGNFFSLGPQLQLPIFNNGKIKSNIAANDARVEQEKIAYRNELLTAFEEAANAIAAFQRQREREAKLGSASQSARTALDLSIDLEKAGLNDFLSVLDAERGLLDADYQRSIARTQVLVESVALYKALAGGWPN
ncbi:MAG: efflux transporter outer membrane subunit, partial [Acidobacteria bacterium]|nr:efflux transporter outer membrane subunit [Acidobacteriota bacterium]